MSGVKILKNKGKIKGEKEERKELTNTAAVEMFYNLTMLIKDARPGRDTRL